jgi:hypothetical protein
MFSEEEKESEWVPGKQFESVLPPKRGPGMRPKDIKRRENKEKRKYPLQSAIKKYSIQRAVSDNPHGNRVTVAEGRNRKGFGRKDSRPVHVRRGESYNKANPAIKWKRAASQSPPQAGKLGAGKMGIKGSTQHGLSQFSYEEIGGPTPWERQPMESIKAYAQFQVYRDMNPPDRGYLKVAEKLHLSQVQIAHAGAVQRWVERASAWDFHLERARLQQTEQYQAEMAARHAEIAKEMLGKVKQRLLSVNLKTLGPKEISQWLEVGVKVERLSRGLSSEAAEKALYQTNVQINHLTKQEIMTELAREGVKGASHGKAQRLLEEAASNGSNGSSLS